MEIRALHPSDTEALRRFLARVPQADRTFFKEDVEDPSFADGLLSYGPARTVAVQDGEVVGWLALAPLHGSSNHVGEVRLIVDPQQRGRGIGRLLARRAVIDAGQAGLKKLVVEVIAGQDEVIAMFRDLGFVPEALLADHVRDRDGELRDLMVLAHGVDEQLTAIVASGVVDDI